MGSSWAERSASPRLGGGAPGAVGLQLERAARVRQRRLEHEVDLALQGGSSTGTMTSTRESRLRGIMSAEPRK